MNDVLQEFKIVFGINTAPLDKGLKQTESKIKSFGKVFNSVVATYFSYKLFQGAIQGFTDFNLKIQQATDLMGYSAENVTALGGALKRFGGDTDSAISSLNSLSSSLQQAKQGGGALIDVAKQYGITFTNSNGALLSAESLLSSLGTQLQRYDKQTRVAIANQLGLDNALVRAYADGGAELNRLIAHQKAYGVTTAHDMKISKAFNHAILDLKDSFNGIVKMFSRLVLPSLTKLVKLVTRFIEFLKKHKQLVMIFFAGLVVAMLPVLALFTKMAIASAAAFAPIYAVVGVVSAIALIFEDIYYYFMGWDSVTGDLVKKFPALAKVLEFIRPLVVGIVDTFSAIIDFLKDPSWDSFVNIFKVAGNVIKTYLLGALDLVKQSLMWIYDKTIGLLSKLGGKLFGGGGDIPQAPAISASGGGGNTTNNATYNVNQTINTDNGKAVADGFNSAIKSVNQQKLQR